MRVKNFQETISKVQLHLNDYLQEHGINTAGMFRCINPEHDDHSPSCSTNGGDGTLFHCFSCTEGSGDIFKAAHFLEDKPLGGIEWITDNLAYLANKYNIPIETTPLTDDEIYELNTYRAYKFASEYFVSHQETDAFKKVIAERNWSKELCAEFGCGTVPSFKEFRGYMKDLGFAAPFLDEIDLGRREMFDSNNFIFTIKDDIGRPVGFSSRNLDYTDDKLNGSKYVNQKTTGPRCNIYRKGSRLFGIDRLVKKQKNKSEIVYIFEGYSDVLTAVQNGLTNCVAVGGVAFTAEQLQLLKEHNFYSLCMALDGDSVGQERMMALLDTTLGGQKDVRISLVMVPAGQDPDDLIRANGIEEFKKLRKWSAFEWRLSRFAEDADAETLCKAMVPLIVNESSSVNQEKMERILAEHTGVTQRAIHSDVEALQNTKEAERKREKQKIYDRLRYTLDRRPEEGELAIQEAQEHLFDLAREHNEDSFSEEAYIAALQQQKELDEAKDGKFSGYLLGYDLAYLQNALCGNWKDKWFCIGGAENSGKTALVCKMLFEIASCEENNAICIYHTIDDTKEELNPRMVCIAERTRSLAINQVLDPNYFIKHGTSVGMLEKRERGYNELIKLVRAGRFVMKDSNDGDSLAYVERLIKYYREKYPDRNLIYALDNFHKIRDLQTNSKDERVRFKTLSTLVKALATKYHITIISTVEYTKLPQGQKPVNNSVGETRQVAYDANVIVHLYNDLHEFGEKATHYHIGVDSSGEQIRMPRLMADFGKNKISSFKGRVWLDFFPECSDFVSVDPRIPSEDERKAAEVKKERKGTAIF